MLDLYYVAIGIGRDREDLGGVESNSHANRGFHRSIWKPSRRLVRRRAGLVTRLHAAWMDFTGSRLEYLPGAI